MRRVVVTGLGMVTPLACGVEETWSRLVAGESGASVVDTFEVSDLACRIACTIPRGDGSNGTFNADDWMDPKDQRKVDPFIVFALAAAKQALLEATDLSARAELAMQLMRFASSGRDPGETRATLQ